uniref:Chromo domain-containing protein n=1 Tax=Caenorhabditis japonica TaxID=281687 RepID=A0A8R1ET38_CAEJA
MYEVERIIAHRLTDDLYLLVRWSGYGPADDTWELEKELRVSAIEAVTDYYNRLEKSEKLELIKQLREKMAENEALVRKSEKKRR